MLNTPIALKDLARLDRQMRRDQDVPLRQLQERDRRIGAQVQKASPLKKLGRWLDATAPTNGAHRLGGIEVSVGFWLGMLGLALGLTAMSGLLMVDQQQPVNVLLLLAIFVGAQWLLLLATLIVSVALAMHSQLHLPLEGLNPARWLFRRAFSGLADEIRHEQFTPVLRLALLTWGQVFGLFFNLGAMAALLIILLVVDRSFGWSSTLDISSDGLHNMLQWLAKPWAGWLPEATVNAELVDATRYQSLQTEFSGTQIVAMREWWPFLLACIGCYGLLPRLALWFIFYACYRRTLVQTFVNYPGARMALERMNSPLVHTRGHSHETALEAGTDSVIQRTLPSSRKRFLVDWSGALEKSSPPELKAPNTGDEEIVPAGLSLREDQQLLDSINQTRNDVLILVKSWEPPLSELGDFLRGISPKLDCYLLLLPLPGRGVKADELSDWQQFARQKHHPRVMLVPADTVEPVEPRNE